jgi:hypothetical protein
LTLAVPLHLLVIADQSRQQQRHQQEVAQGSKSAEASYPPNLLA